ncbi:MAG: DMT family transporter [Candidatus Altiarchaeota archaeon]|nr:DMT family transporter [Candidatus Altiarchaeota archaeon]
MDKERFGVLLVLLTALESSVAIIVNRFFVLKVDPVIFTAVRAILIGITFFIVSKYMPKPKKAAKTKDLAVLGLIGGGLAFLLFFTGLKLTTGGRAALIHKTLPLWAAIIGYYFLKEKITRNQKTAIGVAILGLLILQYDNLPTDIRWGDALVLGATLLWAIENGLAKKFMNLGENNWRVTYGRMFFGSLFLFGVLLLQGKLSTLLSLQLIQWVYILVSTILLTWYVLTWYWSLKFINLSKAAGFLLISPVISLVLGIVFLGESIYPMQVFGSVLILGALMVLASTKSERIYGELP